MRRHRRDPSGFRWLGLAACVLLACNRTPKASPAAAVPATSPPASDVPPSAPADAVPEIAVGGSAEFSTLVDALAKGHGPGESWYGVLFGPADPDHPLLPIRIVVGDQPPRAAWAIPDESSLLWYLREDPRARLSAVLSWSKGQPVVTHPAEAGDAVPLDPDAIRAANTALTGTAQDGILVLLVTEPVLAADVLDAVELAALAVHDVVLPLK